jgi:hypothetical protein
MKYIDIIVKSEEIKEKRDQQNCSLHEAMYICKKIKLKEAIKEHIEEGPLQEILLILSNKS